MNQRFVAVVAPLASTCSRKATCTSTQAAQVVHLSAVVRRVLLALIDKRPAIVQEELGH